MDAGLGLRNAGLHLYLHLYSPKHARKCTQRCTNWESWESALESSPVQSKSPESFVCLQDGIWYHFFEEMVWFCITYEALQRDLGSREHMGENAREQGAMGQNDPVRWAREGKRNLGSMANLAKEQTKYDLGSREQRGHFTTGAASMGSRLQSLTYIRTFLIFTDNSGFFTDILIFLHLKNGFLRIFRHPTSN